VADDELTTMGVPLRVTYTNARGFHLQMSIRGGSATSVRLPEQCLNVVCKGNMITCTTRTMMKLNGERAVASLLARTVCAAYRSHQSKRQRDISTQ
jgi:hypothetical protein